MLTQNNNQTASAEPDNFAQHVKDALERDNFERWVKTLSREEQRALGFQPASGISYWMGRTFGYLFGCVVLAFHVWIGATVIGVAFLILRALFASSQGT